MASTISSDNESFDDAAAALDRICHIYDENLARLNDRLHRFSGGERNFTDPHGCYPYLRMSVECPPISTNTGNLSYGNLPASGTYGTTLSDPHLFRTYYEDQISLLLKNHPGFPVEVGTSDTPIPLPFAVGSGYDSLSVDEMGALQSEFVMPDLARIDDSVANGTYEGVPGTPSPLALFNAERVDYSLWRLRHYTGTTPQHFQRYILFTNYQRYVDGFIDYAREQVSTGDTYRAFVEPGNVVTPNPRLTDKEPSGEAPANLPQMPAYHLVADGHQGITLINIGVGPSNSKTITDHVAVLRPHCWLMIGHCGGLRRTQRLGDYVLAHAYVRGDHVLDHDLPSWVPVPPIAEIQVALTQAVSDITGVVGAELKHRLRTGTVYTTDDRDWELHHQILSRRFNQSRAIAVEMESATIAANGYRFRVPYGTLLCVSDKPLHGEIKLPGMANAFYDERVNQHLHIGIRTLEALREGVASASLHSRKLRSFDEPAFR
jgi:AMP nucleosidase